MEGTEGARGTESGGGRKGPSKCNVHVRCAPLVCGCCRGSPSSSTSSVATLSDEECEVGVLVCVCVCVCPMGVRGWLDSRVHVR